VDDVYVDWLESGESEYDLDYEYNDEESDNDNTITKNEEDWLTEWDKYYKWDKNKKEFIRDRKRIPGDLVHYNIQQINKVKKRKDKERDLEIKQLNIIYPNFNSERFDNSEDYEIEWTNKYNKERVKNQYLYKKINK
jgi:hypothetical protein